MAWFSYYQNELLPEEVAATRGGGGGGGGTKIEKQSFQAGRGSAWSGVGAAGASGWSSGSLPQAMTFRRGNSLVGN